MKDEPRCPDRRQVMLGLGLSIPWFWATAAEGAATLPVTIQLAPDRPGPPTNPRLLGTNTPWVFGSEGLLDDSGHWHPAMLVRARELSPPLLRYPGLPDTYRWRQGLGPIAERQPVFAYDGQPPQKILYGTQEFLETCEALSADPLIQVNLHEGDTSTLARQAADWVGFLRDGSLRSRVSGRALKPGHLWELGNEPYLMDSRRPDGRPNPLFLRPDAYAARTSQVLAAMRAVDPGLRAGLPFALDTYSGRPWRPNSEPATVVGEQLGFADKILTGLDRPQDIGFLSLHYYMPLFGTPYELDDAARIPDDEALYWGAMAGTETLRRHLDNVKTFWRQHPRTAALPVPPFMVTEYNSFFTNAHRHGQELAQNSYVMTLAGALFVADLILMLCKQSQVEAALQWSLNGDWVFGAIAPDPVTARARPVFQAMLLARRLLEAGGHLLETRVAVETTDRADRQVGLCAAVTRLPLATALATRHGSQLRMLVINKDPAREAAITLQLGDAAVAHARVEGLTARARFAAADRLEAATPVEAPTRVGADGRSLSAQLGPASLALWTIELRA
jgi:alpha-L-arabinofuranosidase